MSNLPKFLQSLNVKSITVTNGHPKKAKIKVLRTHIELKNHTLGGCFFPETKEIIINQDLIDISKLQIFIHELVHVLNPKLTELEVSADVKQLMFILNVPFETNGVVFKNEF